MTQKFIAIANKGQEFSFKRSSMIAVPSSSAKKIADVLTDIRYKLNEGEVWHVYDNDYYYNDYIGSEIRRFGKSLKIYSYCG